MENNKFTVLFLLQKVRINKQGKCPIRFRITYNNKRKENSTGLFVEPDNWNSKKQKTISTYIFSEFINTQLSLISQKLHQAFLLLQVNDNNFDVDDIILTYKGESIKKEKTFLEVLELHNNRMEKLVGKEYAPRYYQKWKGTFLLLKGFIKKSYNKNDVLLNKITSKFLDDLDFYLKTEKNQKQITINKCIQRVRTIIKLAISEGFLIKDPFVLYKPKRYKKEVLFLTKEELFKIENHQFSQPRLEQVKDMFVFCCYTGLAYAEMSNLKNEHIIKGFDNNIWINMFRDKTDKQFSVPVLDKALRIIEKYSNSSNKESLLPVISNQKFNSYIKEVADIVGINKKLTHHIARKTFATTVLLYNDVPIEIVSELLGHSKITVTQEHYAKVVKKNVSEHMKKLKKKLRKK